MQALAPRHDFIGVEDAAYLYTGAESAPLKSQAQALERYLQERAHGEAGRAEHIRTETAVQAARRWRHGLRCG